MLQMYPKPRKKSVMPTDYRNKILNAAKKAFSQKGYAKCTMSDVANQAKVGIGTLYNYFKNKDELLQLCIQKTIQDELEVIHKNSQHIEDPLDKLRYFFAEHFNLLKENPTLARLLLVEVRQSEGFYKRNPTYNPMKFYLDFYKKIYDEALEKKMIRNVDTEALVHLIVGTQEVLLLQWFILGEDFDIETIFQGVRDIVKFGVDK